MAIFFRILVSVNFAHSAVKLANGNILIPDTNADRLVEIDAAGKTVLTSAEWWGQYVRMGGGETLTLRTRMTTAAVSEDSERKRSKLRAAAARRYPYRVRIADAILTDCRARPSVGAGLLELQGEGAGIS